MADIRKIVRSALLLIAAAGSFVDVNGALIMWQSAVSSNWNNTGNWSTGVVPTASDTVLFDAGIGNCTLDFSTTVAGIKFTSAYTGTLSCGADTLTIAGNADFSGLYTFSPGSGTVVIRSEFGKRSVFVPGSKTFNNLVLWNNGSGGSLDTTEVISASLVVANDLVFRQNKSVSVPNTSVWRFDNANTAVTVIGNVEFEENNAAGSTSANSNLFMGTGTWTFKKNAVLPIGTGVAKYATLVFSGTETQACSSWVWDAFDSLGTIQHTGNDTLRLKNFTKARSFFQTGGTLDLNGYDISVSGDMNINNGTSASFANLDQRTITIGGNGSFGGSAGNMINLDVPSWYYINMNGGSLSANYARIGNSYVNGTVFGGYAFATNSRKIGYTSNVWQIPGATITWTGTVNSSFKNPANWSPAFCPADSDSVVFNTGFVQCNLDTNITIKTVRFAPGYSGTFDFGANNLTIKRNADFSNVGNIAFSTGTLYLTTDISGKRIFTPKNGVAFPNMYTSGPGGTGDTLVINGSLTAQRYQKEYGVLDFGNNGWNHSVQSFINMMSGEINFGNCTLSIADTFKTSNPVKSSTGACIKLTKSSGVQKLIVWSGDTLPSIRQTGGAQISLDNNLVCRSFENNGGSLALNGYNMSAAGNIKIVGGANTLPDLSGRKLWAGGAIELRGYTADSLHLYCATDPCTLFAAKSLSLTYGVLGKCIATGTPGYAIASRDNGANVNWVTMPLNTRKWAGIYGKGKWSDAANWIPSDAAPSSLDSVVFDGTSVASCTLDVSSSVKAIKFATGYTGTFHFSSNMLNVYGGGADFSNVGDIDPGTATLSFGATAICIPHANDTLPNININSATVTIATNPLRCGLIQLNSGMLGLGNGKAHLAVGIVGVAGSAIDFGTGSSFAISGGVHLEGFNIIAALGDSLICNGSAPQQLVMPPSANNLTIVVNGTGGATLTNNPCNADKLVLKNGILHCGNGLVHQFNSIATTGGDFEFDNSTVRVVKDADFSGCASVIPWTGVLEFTGVTGPQIFKPHPTSTLPTVVHLSGSKLEIKPAVLKCQKFQQAGSGTLDLTADIYAVDTLRILDASTSTFYSGIAGRTLSAAYIEILADPVNPINLAPASAWTLSASFRASISNALIGNCNASACVKWPILNNCINNGGNTRLDFAGPTVGVTSPKPSSVVSSVNAINGTATDSVSGIAEVEILIERQSDAKCWNGTVWGDMVWQKASGTTAWSYSLTGAAFADGSYGLRVKSTDSAGHVSTEGYVAFTVKTTAPANPRITILDKKGFTNASIVTLECGATGADSMQFMINAGTWSAWEMFTSIKTDFVISANGSGAKKIFAQYKDVAGNVSTIVSDSIVYDTIPPQPISFSIQDNNGYTGSPAPQYALSAAGADSMRFSRDTAAWMGWVSYATAANGIDISAGGDGVKKVFVQFKDKAGNLSIVGFDTTIYDSRLPSVVSVVIGDRAGYTNSGRIRILTTATNADSMRIALASDTAIAAWKQFATADSFTMSNTSEGKKWVYVQVKTVGNTRSVWVCDSTMLDVSMPKATTVTRGIFVPAKWPGMISGTAGDAISGIQSVSLTIIAKSDSMRYWDGINFTANPSTQLIPGNAAWQYPFPNAPSPGSYLVLVQAQDSAGNFQLPADTSVFSIYKDTIAPVNALKVTLVDIGDTAVTVSWKIPAVASDAEKILFGNALFALTPVLSPFQYKDTSFIVPVTTPGFWRFGTVVVDTAGNQSAITYDTITVRPKNQTPILVSWNLRDTIDQDSVVYGNLVVNDADENDSDYVLFTAHPTWINAALINRTTQQFTIAIGGTPVVKDTGWNKVAFNVQDRGGIAFTVRDSIFVKARYAITVYVDKKQTKIAGAAARFTLATTGVADSGMSYEIDVRSFDDPVFAKHVTSTGGMVSLFPLTDGKYEMSIRVKHGSGIMDTAVTRDTFTITGATTRHFAAAADSSGPSWQMVSFPGQSMSLSAIAAFGTLYHWDESMPERTYYGYYRKATELGFSAPGMGYWRRATDTGMVSIPRTSVVDSVVTITLYKGAIGWNQIASPFPYPVAWTSNTMLWKWNETTHDFSEAGTVLEPWLGYWVAVDSTTTIRLENKPLYVAPAFAKRNVASYTDTANWQVRFSYKNEMTTDAENIIGLSSAASNSYDAHDAAEPPRMAQYGRMFIAHPEWNRGEFARDIRKTISGVETFVLGIAPSEKKTRNAGTIRISGMDRLPKKVAFYVVDKAEDLPTQIDPASTLSVQPADSVLYKTVFVTADPQFLRKYPRAFEVSQPYPNPARSFANIKYTLPYRIGQNGVNPSAAYSVHIALYDVRGRLVRSIAKTEKMPGIYTSVWDGKDNAGSRVAAGMYVVRLKADRLTAVKKLWVIR